MIHPFSIIFSHLCDSSNIIIAGDFNTVIDPEIDCSSISSNTRSWPSTKTIKQYMEHYELGDGWRMINPSSREYTYFSSLHHDLFYIVGHCQH
uniref:Endonuclease/exonuclease/phosphatase domain-containing protein n=1 Tax=Monopterus albus TaxID=43700 RepID=A0A3Q3J0K3_MONAL